MKDETVLVVLMSLCNCLGCRADAPCKHVRLALDAIETHYAAQHSVQPDVAKCAATDCENPGIYNIWLCSTHGNPPRR
jgi:hypothetical protein